MCEDETGKLDCVFFNSYEGYIRKILPLNAKVTISGKIGYYNKKYQITNPTHLSEDPNSVKKIDKSYSLTEGLNNKLYNKIIQEVLKNIPNLDEWLDKETLKKFDNISWKKAVLELHNPNNINKKGNFLERLIFDEILSTFLINSKIRKTIKKFKKEKKIFDDNFSNNIKKNLITFLNLIFCKINYFVKFCINLTVSFNWFSIFRFLFYNSYIHISKHSHNHCSGYRCC